MTQSPLNFNSPFQSHSETSIDAARSIRSDTGRLRAMVLDYIRNASTPYGATDEEIQRVLGMNPSTERPRRVELVNLGLVRDSGYKRKTSSGRLAVVWCAVA